MRYARFSFVALLLLCISGVMASAQTKANENPNVQWKLLTPSLSGKAGETVEVKVRATIAKGSHLYSLKPYPKDALAPQNTEISVGEKSLLTLGHVKTPKPISHYDENFEIQTEYWENAVTFTIPVKIAGNASGKEQGWVSFYFMTCNDQTCMPPTAKKFTFDLDITRDSSGTASAAAAPDTALSASALPAGSDTTTATRVDTAGSGAAAIAPGKGDPATISSPSTPPEDDLSKAREKGVLAYILAAGAGGLLALMTPCVFPMVPITVSVFTKRKHVSRGRSIRDAGIYSLGIILTFTVIGLVITAIFGASGLNKIAANPWVNIFIATVFVIMALNLFGMFEIQVPSSIVNRLNKKSGQGDSITSLLLMGLVFTLTSFTCTIGVVSTILVTAAKGEFLWPLFGMLSFSAVFAAPFFILALFPALMKSLPQSGGWLNAVKVVMGFVETAAAIKFISNADLVMEWGVFTRELFLAIWVAIAVMISVYLLGRFQLTHDTPVERVGPMRVLLASAFLAAGIWLVTGLFGGRLGEIDALIPPQDYPGKGNTSVLASLSSSLNAAQSSGNSITGKSADGEAAGKGGWTKDDYGAAVALARKSGKPIFIDFTGYTCTNCRWMELNMFSREDVSSLMKNYVLLRLYTDRLDSINQWNRNLQVTHYNTIELPYYAIITPDGKTISARGWTRNSAEFIDFLKKAAGGNKQALAER